MRRGDRSQGIVTKEIGVLEERAGWLKKRLNLKERECKKFLFTMLPKQIHNIHPTFEKKCSLRNRFDRMGREKNCV